MPLLELYVSSLVYGQLYVGLNYMAFRFISPRVVAEYKHYPAQDHFTQHAVSEDEMSRDETRRIKLNNTVSIFE